MILNYKYVLLDVDGVVLSSIDYYTALFRDIAEHLGASKNIPDTFYKKNIGVKIITWMDSIVPAENHHRIKDVFFEKNRDASEDHQLPLVAGAREALLKIKENNKMTCFISTKTRASLNVMMKHHNLEPLIDHSISCDEVNKFKPDPEGIVKALRYFNAGPSEAVFIGDSLHDLGAARNAGVGFVGVLSGICTKSEWESEKVPYVASIKDLVYS